VRTSVYLPALLAALVVLAVPVLVPAAALTAAAVIAVALIAAIAAALVPRVLGVGAPLVTTAVLALAAGGALVAVTLAPDTAPLQWWPLAPAASVLVLFVLQLLRGAEATQKVDSLARGIAAVLCLTSAAGWVVVARGAVLADSRAWIIVTGLVAWVLAGLLGWGLGRAAGGAPVASQGRAARAVGAALLAVAAAGAPAAVATQVLTQLLG